VATDQVPTRIKGGHVSLTWLMYCVYWYYNVRSTMQGIKLLRFWSFSKKEISLLHSLFLVHPYITSDQLLEYGPKCPIRWPPRFFRKPIGAWAILTLLRTYLGPVPLPVPWAQVLFSLRTPRVWRERTALTAFLFSLQRPWADKRPAHWVQGSALTLGAVPSGLPISSLLAFALLGRNHPPRGHSF